MSTWNNADGLSVRFSDDPTVNHMGETKEYGPIVTRVVDFTYNTLPTFTHDLNNDGTLDGFAPGVAFIPAGAFIKSAVLVVTEDWASSDAATLTIGTHEADGTVIDADGIDGAIAVADLDAGDVVVCNGDLVTGVASLNTHDGYLVVTKANTWTTGSARLVVELILPTKLTTV